MKPQFDPELKGLAKAIDERETVLCEFRDKLAIIAGTFLAECSLSGQDLISAQSRVGREFFHNWATAYCPRSVPFVPAYTGLARGLALSKPSKQQLVRAAARLIEPRPPNPDKKEQWPPFLQSIQHLYSIKRMILKNPVEGWPAEGIAQAKAELKAVASYLGLEVVERK
jgi:hypothetical protein